MRFLVWMPMLLALANCGGSNSGFGGSNGDCGAKQVQPLVGRDAVDIVKFLDALPKSVQDNAYVIGQNEGIGGDAPSGALIVKTDRPEVHEPRDLLGAKIMEVYCRP